MFHQKLPQGLLTSLPLLCVSLNFTKSSALQLSKYGIRVNTILPGWTRTPFTEHLYLNQNHKESRENQIPLGRWGCLLYTSDAADEL